MQDYQLIADGTEQEIYSVGEPGYTQFAYDFSADAIDSSRGPITAHMQRNLRDAIAGIFDWDVFAVRVPTAGTQISILPDLAVFGGLMLPETTLSVSIYELKKEVTVHTKDGTEDVRYILEYKDVELKQDELAQGVAQSNGWNFDPGVVFHSFVTQSNAGTSVSLPVIPNPYDPITSSIISTGVYLIQLNGHAFDVSQTPGTVVSSTNQTDAGRYLIAFGHPTGQRANTWGNGWIDTVALGPAESLPPTEVFPVPTNLEWSNTAPGSFQSPAYSFDPSTGRWSVRDIAPADQEDLDFYEGPSWTTLIETVAEQITDVFIDKYVRPNIAPEIFKSLERVKEVFEFGHLQKNFVEDMMTQIREGMDAISNDRPWSDEQAWRRVGQHTDDLLDLRSGSADDTSDGISDAVDSTRFGISHSDLNFLLQDSRQLGSFQAAVGHAYGIFGAAKGDSIEGGSEADLLIGQKGNDRLAGAAGNDRLAGGGGNDLLDGGTGTDIALYGIHDSVVVERSGAGFTVKHTDDGILHSDSLVNVERLQLRNDAIALDVDGIGGQVYRLYQAAFDRTPDLVGIGFWLKVMDLGLGLRYVAGEFSNSAEFKQLYGSQPTNNAIVEHFYHNVLHRDADPGGFAFWVNALDSGVAVQDVLMSFSESKENIDGVAATIANGFAYTPYYF